MNICQQDERDISKVFNFLRAQLRAKEKELLELQRADPCLLIPDSEQIYVLIDAIASLQLSTQDDSFVFASVSDYSEVSAYTSICSADFNSIKSLPPSVWLSPSKSLKEQKKQRPSIFSHLLALPIRAYLSSSWPSTFQTTSKTHKQVPRRIPLLSHLLFMPIDTFKSPSSTISTSLQYKNNKNLESNPTTTTEGTRKSLLNAQSIFSKELWLQNKPVTSYNTGIFRCT